MADTRTILGEFLTALAAKIFQLVGEVERECPVATEPQSIDLSFIPDQRALQEKRLGWFGTIAAQGRGMLECYSWTPSPADVDACVRKQLNFHHQLTLEATRAGLPRPLRPLLWILAPGRPQTAMHDYQAGPMDGWPAGFWQAYRGSRLRFVVARELPEDRSTLLLRLYGRDEIRWRALRELELLSHDALERRLITTLGVAMPRQILQALAKEAGDMTAVQVLEKLEALAEQALSQARQEGMEKGMEKGVEKGLKRGEQTILVRQLVRRFGPLPPQVLERIDRADVATLERWSERVLDAPSLDEVLAEG